MIARIARDPKDFTSYEALGDYYLESENIRDAKECYRQVLKLSPVHRMVKIKIRRLEKLLTKAGE
jgi:cytochrome c-type biogenesis protein CcmH/NrfG